MHRHKVCAHVRGVVYRSRLDLGRTDQPKSLWLVNIELVVRVVHHTR